jgi:biopolymer transport protein ExbB/TolQ
MKLGITTTLIFLSIFFSACQQNSTRHAPLYGGQIKNGTNPNSVAHVAQDKALDRKNQVEISKIDAQADIEIAKINAQNALEVAKVNSKVQKEIAIENADTDLEISKMQAISAAHDNEMKLYIAIIFAVILLFGILLWYLHKRKVLELEAQDRQKQLEQNLLIKDRELQEQRIHKIMDLAIHGKLPQNLQQDLINSITNPKADAIESLPVAQESETDLEVEIEQKDDKKEES